MKLTERQAKVLRSYAESEKDGTIPVVVSEIAKRTGHAHGMGVWGLNRVLLALERKGMMTAGSRTTTAGQVWLLHKDLTTAGCSYAPGEE